MVFVPLEPVPVVTFVLLWPLVPAFAAQEPLERVFTREALVLECKPLEPRLVALRNRGPLVLPVLPLEQRLPAFAAQEPLALASVPPEPVVPLAHKPLEPRLVAFRNQEALVLAVLPLGQLLMAFVPPEPPVVLASKPREPLVGEPLPLAGVNLKNLLAVRKNRSSNSPIGASSQIAPPGRSGII
jgi:hypothetical protein